MPELTAEEIYPFASPIFRQIKDWDEDRQEDVLRFYHPRVVSFIRSMLVHPSTTGTLR